MADRRKDDDDKRLDDLFRSVPIVDDGFTARVMARTRRRMLVQRFSLPVAIGMGLAIAAKPLLELVELLPRVFGLLPLDVSAGSLPQTSTIMLGAALLAAIMLAGRILEES